MYQGRNEDEHRKAAREGVLKNGRLAAMLIATILLLALTIGGTLAWLSASTGPIVNKFSPSEVTCKVEENFDEKTGEKTNVNVTNTGNIDAFIRVKLVTYRTNTDGQHIGGTAEIPSFTPGDGWMEYNGYYYYTKPVAPNGKPDSALISSITLTQKYTDADGGMQAIDVIAEAIQSKPEAAVKDAWGSNFGIDEQGNLTLSAGN